MTAVRKRSAAVKRSAAPAGSTATLASFRARIERTDDAILNLLVRRARLARVIGHAKARAGLPVRDPAREARVVRRAATRARELGMPQEDVRALFWGIIALCRAEQLPARGARQAGGATARGVSRGPQ